LDAREHSRAANEERDSSKSHFGLFCRLITSIITYQDDHQPSHHLHAEDQQPVDKRRNSQQNTIKTTAHD
jgi:hypothetical protein